MCKVLGLLGAGLVVLLAIPVAAVIVITASTGAAFCLQQSGGSSGGSSEGSGGGISTVADTTGSGGLGSTTPAVDTGSAGSTGQTAAQPGQVPAVAVQSQLMRLRFAGIYPHLSAEQARNAITIAQVTRKLGLPRRALEVALVTAIQESKLTNIPGGDRDSGGLFQQRPSAGWGTRAQITNPALATEAFFGRAQHTHNSGLLDVRGWEKMSLTEAAATVQRPREDLRGAYAQWDTVAGDIADLLGGDLPDLPDTAQNASADGDCAPSQGAITLGTLNLLGAGHTNGGPGGDKRPGYAGWASRLPKAMDTLDSNGVEIAALQEVHAPQARALAGAPYTQKWGMFPATGRTQNKVVWDRAAWQLTGQRLITIPYFKGARVSMPMAHLTSTTTGQSIWVWSIHNPANSYGPVRALRIEALHREQAVLKAMAAAGEPVVIMGDFNDGKDGVAGKSHCVLTPTVTNAFGAGSTSPCAKPKGDSYIDHIYGANLTWISAREDMTPKQIRAADHPLVIATTGSDADDACAVGPSSAGASTYHLGNVKPQLTALVNSLGPRFNIRTVGGYRASAHDPGGHPSGLAADFMTSSKSQGDALAAYAKAHAAQLGVDYVIWRQRIWSTQRAGEGWRAMEDRGSPTENHMDHVHINVKPHASIAPGAAAVAAECSGIVTPLKASLMSTDRHNWHQGGSHWGSWHTGTDYSVACGTPVYASNGGSVEIDTTQSWAGHWLVKVSVGPHKLSTWYAHMEKVTVSRGQSVRPGQQIGKVGDEGNAAGCHLHFEVHTRGGSIYGPDNTNPSTWLPAHLKKSSAV